MYDGRAGVRTISSTTRTDVRMLYGPAPPSGAGPGGSLLDEPATPRGEHRGSGPSHRRGEGAGPDHGSTPRGQAARHPTAPHQGDRGLRRLVDRQDPATRVHELRPE